MTERLYAFDRIGTGHLVAAQDDCSRKVTTHCGHPVFSPQKPPVAQRPHVDAYCAGCKGWEEQQEKGAAK